MKNFVSNLRPLADTLGTLRIGGPGVCNLAVTNACNARCDFCNYAYHKGHVKEKIWVDLDAFRRSAAILFDRGIRYMTLVGGEPTLHPHILEIVSHAARNGIRPSIVTNGSRLTPALVRRLKVSGLKTLFVSIDSDTAEAHERNRGLPGVCHRIRLATRECARLDIPAVASVTINKLIRDIPPLLQFLSKLGLNTVNFAYPKTALNSSALSYSQDSGLIDYSPDEFLDVLGQIQRLKGKFPILNSNEALSDISRFIRGEEQIYPCFAGYKYFFVDYFLDVYRCDYWPTKMSPLHRFREQPFIRDRCTECISGCYRDASVLMHAGVSFGDALRYALGGHPVMALREMGKRSNFLSVKSILQDWRTLRKFARSSDSHSRRASAP